MANMLQGEGTPPPPDLNNANGAASATRAPMMPPMPAQGGAEGQPAPTHAQTVAALRHFDKIKRELEGLIENPELGKSDMKSQIIDGFARLVADRMMSPAQAVVGLAAVPTEPFQQKKWAQTQLAQAQQAEDVILDHFGAANPHFDGGVDHHFGGEMPAGGGDDHMDHMQALMATYSKKKA